MSWDNVQYNEHSVKTLQYCAALSPASRHLGWIRSLSDCFGVFHISCAEWLLEPTELRGWFLNHYSRAYHRLMVIKNPEFGWWRVNYEGIKVGHRSITFDLETQIWWIWGDVWHANWSSNALYMFLYSSESTMKRHKDEAQRMRPHMFLLLIFISVPNCW